MKKMKRVVVAVLVFVLAGLGYHTSTEAQDVPPIISPLDASGLRYAVRLDPPKPPPPPPVLWTTESQNGRCVGMINALTYWNPGWDVNRMAGIAYRESRCDPNASNSCCSGIMQIHRSWIDNVAMCGVYSRNDLYDPWKNICAAAVVFREQGISAWSTA